MHVCERERALQRTGRVITGCAAWSAGLFIDVYRERQRRISSSADLCNYQPLYRLTFHSVQVREASVWVSVALPQSATTLKLPGVKQWSSSHYSAVFQKLLRSRAGNRTKSSKSWPGVRHADTWTPSEMSRYCWVSCAKPFCNLFWCVKAPIFDL